MREQILAARKFITETMMSSRSVQEVSIKVAANVNW
jgi:hypothetical protein